MPAGQGIVQVFDRSGFVQLPSPPNISMFFAPRAQGPYSSFLDFDSGVGITLDATATVCHVTIEALSPDVGCAPPLGRTDACGAATMRSTTAISDLVSAAPYGGGRFTTPCPVVPSTGCVYTSAPSPENDAAVDELARRLEGVLGAHARVDRRAPSAVR